MIGLRGPVPVAENTAVSIYGEGSTPVVLVHGIVGLLNSWWYNIPALTTQHTVYEIALPDYRDTTSGYAPEEFVEHVLEVTRKQGLSRFHLIGHSLGGQIAATIAARHPELVDRLILISASGLFDEAEDHSRFIVRKINEDSLRTVVKSLVYPEHLTGEMVSEALAYYEDKRRLSGMLRTARKTVAAPIDRMAADIKAPTLVCWGGNDAIIPAFVGRRLAELIPDAEFVLYPRSRHAPHMENATEFNERALRFLGG